MLNVSTQETVDEIFDLLEKVRESIGPLTTRYKQGIARNEAYSAGIAAYGDGLRQEVNPHGPVLSGDRPWEQVAWHWNKGWKVAKDNNWYPRQHD